MKRVNQFLTLLILTALTAVASGCGSSDKSKNANSAIPAAEEVGCKQVSAPAPREQPKLPAPHLHLDPNKTYRALLTTSCGTIEIKLDARHSPKTAASFVSLTRKHFYDGLIFHRVVPGFVIQGGDPTGTGSGGPGYKVTERPPSNASYAKGVVAMAKAGTEKAGTSGSQFFIVTAEDAQLPPEYALLGRVTKGMETVDRIAAVATEGENRPVAPVVIDKIEIK